MGVEGLRQIVRGSLAGDQRQLAGSRQQGLGDDESRCGVRMRGGGRERDC
jgi:hypothetical protein